MLGTRLFRHPLPAGGAVPIRIVWLRFACQRHEFATPLHAMAQHPQQLVSRLRASGGINPKQSQPPTELGACPAVGRPQGWMWCRSAPWSSASDIGCAVKAGQAGTGRGFVSTCQARESSWPWREFALLEAPASFFESCHATVRRCTEEDGVYRMRDTPKRLRQISNSPPRCAGRRRRWPSPSWFLNGFLESPLLLRRGRVVAAPTRETQAMLSRIPSPSDVAARVAVSPWMWSCSRWKSTVLLLVSRSSNHQPNDGQ